MLVASRRSQASRRKRSRVSIARVLVAVVAAAVLIGAGYGLVRASQDPRLALASVDVTGCDRLPPADVIRAASFSTGQNIWLLDVRGAATRIAGLSWVSQVAVRRSWPNHVTIAVQERRPSARLSLPSSGDGEEPAAREALIDGGLRVLAIGALDPRDAGLPVLDAGGLDPSDVRLGADLDSTAAAPAFRALQALQAAGLTIVGMRMDPVTGISAQTGDGLHVLFGAPDDLPRKVALFKSIAKKIDRPRDVRYVDVRSLRAPTVLFR